MRSIISKYNKRLNFYGLEIVKTPQNLRIIAENESSITYEWDEVLEAYGYVLEIASNPDFNTILDTVETTNTIEIWGKVESPSGNYFARVKAFIQTPENSVAPSLSPPGSQSTGTLITCNTGTWSGNMPITYTYKWYRDGVAFTNTGNTYTIQSEDDGTEITCIVTAKNKYGSSSLITSNSVLCSNYNPDVQAYFDRLSVQPSSAQKAVINQWYSDLKSAVGNVFTSFDYIGLRGIASASDSLLNFLGANHSASYAGGMSASDWVEGEGFTGDAISKRLLVSYNPSTQGVAYTLNNCSLFCFVHNLNGSAVGSAIIGHTDPTGTFYSEIRVGTAGQELNISAFGGAPASGFTQSRLIERGSSITMKVFNDGVADANNPISNNSASIPNANISELAATFGTGAFGHSNATLFATAVGRNFSDAEAVGIRNAFVYLYKNYSGNNQILNLISVL